MGDEGIGESSGSQVSEKVQRPQVHPHQQVPLVVDVLILKTFISRM